MHPEIMYQVHQAHLADLRREADEARRAGRRRRRRAAPVVTERFHDVLVFAEHGPSRQEVDLVLEQLRQLEHEMVTTLLHHPMVPSPRAAQEHLAFVLDELRAAGHHTQGALVTGPVREALLTGVHDRHPEAVILLTGRHRLAELAHRDLGHRLRHTVDVPVVTVTEGRAPHLV